MMMTWHNGAGSHAGIRKSNARHRQFRVIRCTHHRVSIRHAFLTPERWQATPGKPWRSNNGNCGPYRGPLHIWIENINSRHRRLRQSLTARRNSSPKQLRPRPGGFAKPSKPARNFCKQPIQWIRKECIDTDQHYFVRTTNLANQRQLPLALPPAGVHAWALGCLRYTNGTRPPPTRTNRLAAFWHSKLSERR